MGKSDKMLDVYIQAARAGKLNRVKQVQIEALIEAEIEETQKLAERVNAGELTYLDKLMYPGLLPE